jgi:hypothetical protein
MLHLKQECHALTWQDEYIMDMLCPNCSECIFTLKGLSRDDAIAALEAIGIIEVTIPLTSSYDGKTRDRTYLADKDNELIPNFDRYNGNLDIEEWADGICVHGEINLGDYAYPTMLKIQHAFPDDSWEDINGSEVVDFLQWVIHDKPQIMSKMDEKTRDIREKHVNPQLMDRVVLNPNCSDVVFKIPGITRDQALAKLLDAGIMEVRIPLKIFSGIRDDAISWTVLADKDNQLVPNFDSEFGNDQMDIKTMDDGTIAIHGDINLEYSAFPTMKKIQDAFPGCTWEEMIGGNTTQEFSEWLENGMKYTRRQKKTIKFGQQRQGKNTKKARKSVIDPAFAALNPN